ncbi:TetR/AcrR family transcriptional regulator [Mycobacterium avium]|uniref:TetR/AcrR family transcriptional regulator n=1 Tax=Mycobacterium avium TaxID=1764 RepID=UPI001CC4C91E|nr:TetR family transcriptional regulator [Mycobacterium avium]MBZ4613011.1 TetR family transcriptional regulator [Mycobacterium avium subsp. hominissuis]
MRRAGLKREAVVRAAVKIADAEGIEAISMRRVSQALGVTPMALYRYLPDKDAPIDVVVDESLAVVPVPDPSGSVTAELLRCFGGLYDLLLDHPGLARAAGERPLEGPFATRLGNNVLTLLQHNKIDEADAANLLVSAFSLTLGCALYRTSRSGRTASSRLSQVGDEAPAVRRLRGRLTVASADDTVFRDALTRLIAGYVTTAAKTGGRRR